MKNNNIYNGIDKIYNNLEKMDNSILNFYLKSYNILEKELEYLYLNEPLKIYKKRLLTVELQLM